MIVTLRKRLHAALMLLFIFSGILINPGQSLAQWQQISGLYGEPVYCVRASTSRLYAMTLEGVYDSNNNGVSWSKVPPLYLTNIIERMSADGDTVVAFAQPDSYISTDDGNTWSLLNAPAGGMVFPSEVIVESGVVFMPTYGDYLYKSTNGGTSWTQITAGLTTGEINCAWAEGNNVFVGTDDGVFMSVDGGNTFTFSGLTGEYVTRVYASAPYVFAYSFNGISRSNDNGATWQPFDALIPYSDVTDFAVDGNKVYAATTGDLMSTNVNTANWVAVNFTQSIEYNNSIIKRGGDLLLGNNRGVFKSSDNGITWNDINTGIIPVTTGAVTTLGSDTVFAGNSTYGVSRYDGTQWEFSGQPLLNCFDLITEGNDIYASSEFGIYKTSDGGDTWDFINNPPVNPISAYVANIAVSDSLVLGASLQNGILRSGDFGASWSLQNTGIAPSLVSCVAVSGNNIIVGTYDNGMFVSTDAGFTFSPAGIQGELINDVIVIGNNAIAATNSANGNYISTDDGLTWTPLMTDYFDNLSVYGNYLIASAPGYIQLSLDSGLTYQFNTPAPAGTNIASVTASPADVIIGTYKDGVWKSSFFDITSVKDVIANNLVVKVYPNVFHEESYLYVDAYTLNQKPELRITDIEGKLISTVRITDERTGISAGQLSPGIYFYTVYSENNQSKTGKMVIY